jgi:GGDEF domain-containing protein
MVPDAPERRTVGPLLSSTSVVPGGRRANCGSLGSSSYQNAFIEKLTQALAEAKETQAWLDHALSNEYLDEDRFEEFNDTWDHVCAMIRRMIQRADRFCTSA